MEKRILAVTGLQREAAIVGRQGARTLAGGGDNRRLALELEALADGFDAIISIGIAGGLDPALKPGEAVIGTTVVTTASRYDAAPAWISALQAKLPRARIRAISGLDRIVSGVAEKAGLRAAQGSIAVDMESHVVAEVAARHGLPFVVLRFVCDAADRALPPAALVGLRPDGALDLPAVLKSVAANPRQIPALIRTGHEAETAFSALLRGCQVLVAALGFADVQGV